ncbi:Disease resistance protein RPM1 [Triticum urartu]|uniref:Disease resistance protein RPM1 n=1 Tax=Triticum urartu TaxID=4572 RepID=M7ZJY2_TRIUA|nr:Disease resistance protein RPM1 [Triticum urartu]
MAEAVVAQLLLTLGAALAKEAAHSGGALLGRFKDTDRTTAIFVGEIRGLAFQIEDVVDEFTYKLEDCKHGGFTAKMKKRLKHIKTWRRLAAKLQEIEHNLKHAKQRKKDYTVIGRSASKFTNQALHFTRDEDLVGIEENKERLTRWLTGRGGGDGLEQSSNKVTTVWGMPGVGKTTLVAHVYNNVKVDFDAAAWVTVSESYHLEDVLKKIAAEFDIAVDVATSDTGSLAESIHKYLQEEDDSEAVDCCGIYQGKGR